MSIVIESSDAKYAGTHTVTVYGVSPGGVRQTTTLNFAVTVEESSQNEAAAETTTQVVSVSVAVGSVANSLARGGVLINAGQPTRGYYKTRPF